nr:LacI family DNA-binding transcriptional regulator [Planctomycetota bacterium]
GRLLADLRARRLAGVIWTTFPGEAIVEGPLVRSGLVPSVAIMEITRPHLHSVAIDSHAFMERAIDHLVAQGRRRIALLSVPGHSNDHFRECIHARGLESRPYWLQVLPPQWGASARNLVHLLFSLDPGQRPDALIIADDNLVEEATAGLIAAGVAVPRDLTVVAHCNYPWPTPSAVPTHLLGYDARVMLERCLELLASGPAGATPRPPIPIAPVFDHERTSDPQRQP